MTPAAGDNGKVAHINFDFRRELARKIEGNLAGFCYQCGACVGDCPATTYSDNAFNPRDIMLKVLYGLGDELLTEDSILWQCTNCYNCHERCPQDVKPVEVIISMKNMLADLGLYPPPVEKVIKTFEETGRTTPLSSAVDRQRERFGLPPLPPVPMDEIRKLLEPATSHAEPEAPASGQSEPEARARGQSEPRAPASGKKTAKARASKPKRSRRRKPRPPEGGSE